MKKSIIYGLMILSTLTAKANNQQDLKIKYTSSSEEVIVELDPRIKIRKSGGKSDGNGGIGYNTVEQDINMDTGVWSLICQGAGLEACVFTAPGVTSTGNIDLIDFQKAVEVANDLYDLYYSQRKENDAKQIVLSIPSEDKLRVYSATLIEIEFGVVEIEVVISKL